MDPDQSEEDRMKAQNPAFDINQRDASDHRRSVFLTLAVTVGTLILLFSFFGPQWLGGVMEKAEGGYLQIGIAVAITLFGLSIIAGILRSIYNAAIFASGSTNSIKTNNPIFRIISAVIFLLLAFFVFNYVLAFLSKNEFYKQLEGYFEEGIQIETDEGEKTIKLENGEFSIEDTLAE